mgnify:FL=1
MLWSGKLITAEKAKELGIATYVVPKEEIDRFTNAYIQKLVKGPQHSIRLIKRAVYQNQTMNLRASLDLISSHMGLVTELDDFKEGVQAILEKRDPKFN